MAENERGDTTVSDEQAKAGNIAGLLQLLWKYLDVLKTLILQILKNIHPSLAPITYEKELAPEIEEISEDSQEICEPAATPLQSPLPKKEVVVEPTPFSDYSKTQYALLLLKDLGVICGEKKVDESFSNSDIARSIIKQAIGNARITFAEEFNNLKDDIFQLVDTHYNEIVLREEVVQMLTKKALLNDSLRSDSRVLNSLLTLKKDGPTDFDGFKLDQFKSAETLMELSLDSLNASLEKNDPNLDKSRLFAALARPLSPKPAREQIKRLDAIDIMYDLGSKIMPASIRLFEPVQILQQMIDIGTNYKKIRTLAKLSTLLEIPTPVSTALSLAALVALEHKDNACLAKYISEIKKVRDVPIVHKLCVKIIESSFDAMPLDDVYACALLNCPDEDLDDTLTLIGESTKRRRSMISPPFAEFATEPAFSTIDEYVRKKRKNRCANQPENCGFM